MNWEWISEAMDKKIINTDKIIIAVDGPAASGKGTIAKKIAKNYNLAHMDSGKLYRASALFLLNSNFDLEDEDLVVREIKNFNFKNISFKNKNLLSDKIGIAASFIAKYKGLREYLLIVQQNFAINIKDQLTGVVIDGRDIGTVVLPNADLKFFITASMDVRIERRCKELISLGYNIIKRHVKQEMQERDERDSQRVNSPLYAASDAILLDTTKLDADASYVLVKKHVEDYLNKIG